MDKVVIPFLETYKVVGALPFAEDVEERALTAVEQLALLFRNCRFWLGSLWFLSPESIIIEEPEFGDQEKRRRKIQYLFMAIYPDMFGNVPKARVEQYFNDSMVSVRIKAPWLAV